jgi:hypothetical protein
MNRLFPVIGAFILSPFIGSSAHAGFPEKVAADKPVAFWRLNDPAENGYPSSAEAPLSARVEGTIKTVAGPLPDGFPDFQADNKAIQLSGKGSVLRITDPGANSLVDFQLGDSITLEAWVRCDNIKDGQQTCIIGKGRTQNPGVAANNQNWALRLRGQGGLACVNFLFRDERNRPEAGDEDWHRWTATAGFKPGAAWHHVAVTYTFGKPESIRGYLDGTAVSGAWDMGGPTALGPVVDDDEVWIGRPWGAHPAQRSTAQSMKLPSIAANSLPSASRNIASARLALRQPSSK